MDVDQVVWVRRVAASGVKNVELRSFHAERIPCPDASYDRVVWDLGLMYTPERAVAASEFGAAEVDQMRDIAFESFLEET